MAIEKVIVIDDEPIIRRSLELQFRQKRLSVTLCSTIAETEKQIAKDSFDLMFVDVRLPDGDGTDLLNRLAPRPEKPLIVVMTGYGTIESAVSCIRAGAFDYIIKPFSASQIDVILRKAESFNQALRISQILARESIDTAPLIGENQLVHQMRQMIQKVAPTEATVLISGENGTGKELVATEIFRASARAQLPFIKVNCAAISDTLIESEFFGHERGAFTGATEKREGRFELANNGTILLDEISEISLKLQAKLLRVLQEREFERVGGNRTIKVNVRVLATTNRDLQRSVEQQEFRQDLYYRLNVVPIFIPDLKDRREDIPLLVHHFLEKFAQQHGEQCRRFSNEAMRVLMTHVWPGNVRELENAIEHALTMGSGDILMPEDLPGSVTRPERDLVEEAALDDASLADVERRYILRVLEKTGGHQIRTAEVLGIDRRTLYRRLKQYGYASRRDDGKDLDDGQDLDDGGDLDDAQDFDDASIGEVEARAAGGS